MGVKNTEGGDNQTQGDQKPDAEDPKAKKPTGAADGTDEAGDKNQDGEPDSSKWDDATKAYIKKLRKESAGHRTKLNALEAQFGDLRKKLTAIAGGDEEQELSPEELKTALEATSAQSAFENGVLRLAVTHGIGGDHLDYFQFLMGQRVEALEEGEELDEDAITEVVEKVRKIAGANSPKVKTSVTEGEDGGKTPPNSSEVNLDQFVKMSVAEKSKLYNEQPELYSRLLGEAKAARRLI